VPYRSRLLDGLLDELMVDLPAVLLVGPRAAGKTTTALQRAASVIRLDVPGEALAFRADPDAIIRGASRFFSTNGRPCQRRARP
jgi:hypothetical protein